MYEFWCDYIKPKYQNKANLCHMNTDRFIRNKKIEDVYKDIANHVRFGTSNYEVDRPLTNR